MIRNLKVLAAAAMALASLGALAASAHAAEETFHCSVEPCRIRVRGDGSGKTQHQVFVVVGANKQEVSFTCPNVTAEARRATKTSGALTFSNINYGSETECTVNGSPGVNVTTTGCAYEFTSAGGATGAEIHVECEGTNVIRVAVAGCTYKIGAQRIKGSIYHNIGEPAPVTTEVTVINNVKGIETTQEGAGCKTTEPLTSEYVTGNVIATAETDPEPPGTPVMANGWWE